jgi:DNA-binding MarR family transcriptional regulator
VKGLQFSADECARDVLEVVPLVMRGIRAELRKHKEGDLSVPQFRALFYVSRHEGASLSEVAEHVGLTPPSMSRIVDLLMARGLAKRETHHVDRRRMTLTLTAHGHATLKSAREATETYLRELFRTLPSTKRATIARAMQVLRPVFSQKLIAQNEMGD